MALFIGKCLFDGYLIFGFLAVAVEVRVGAVAVRGGTGRWRWRYGAVRSGGGGGTGRWRWRWWVGGAERKKVGFGKTLGKLWENFGNFYN